jgi:pyrimidine-nucleoside phosphorylase/thymidine phosphorylase
VIVDLIRKKRDGHALSSDEIQAFIRDYSADRVPDYQAAALLMAIFWRGLDVAELAALTEAMLRSGDVLDLSSIPGAKIDKHSTGGVGDKISIPLAPAVAACGVLVPMISGRGLGHTGGTLDKLESIPGFRVDLDVARFKQVLGAVGLSLIGQTERIVPADKRLYALRDVTGTVESIPLIAASIMSKKLAEGIDGLVLDVKVGSGAFMKDVEQARLLARTMVDIGRHAGKKVSALLTDMDQPLGRWVGNWVEVEESIDVMSGRGEADLVELTVALGAEMLRLGGAANDEAEGRAKIARVLGDGSALDRFRRCATLQGGRWPEDFAQLRAPEHAQIKATRDGFVSAIDTEQVGRAGVVLGGGRTRKEDPVDPAQWIRVEKKRGERVVVGDVLCRYSRPSAAHATRVGQTPEQIAADAERRLLASFTIADRAPPSRPLVLEVIR